MKERVLEILKHEFNAISTEELVSKLGNITPEEINEVQKILNEMVQNFELYFTKKEKYILFENCQDIEIGEIDVNPKGFIIMPVTYGEGIKGPFLIMAKCKTRFTFTQLEDNFE